jgi:hypothetical protein
MATRTAVVTTINDFENAALLFTWSGLLLTDDGNPVTIPGYSDRSIQFQGTFGVGGTIQIEGSNDGTNYQVLTDPQGNAISKTSASIEAITELPRFIRPRITGGDGTTNLVASLFMKRVA